MLVARTNLTSSVKRYHNLGASYFTNNDKASLHAVIAYLHVIQKMFVNNVEELKTRINRE